MANETLNNLWPEWQIEKQLGSGSYGTVYKAVRRDNNVESYAAIKVISIPSAKSEVESLRSEGVDLDGTRAYFRNIVDDFVGEIRLMQSLKGVQNIVSVEDYKVVEKTDEIGWDIYIRMELLTPFNAYICDKKLSEEDVIKLGVDICSALEICGKRSVIHRDIKPENIFINDFGDFKLGDFGIARKLENSTGGLSQKGTFNYMAPEVANSADYDARVDTYSLGIVMYRLLNQNRLPFLDDEKQLLNPNARKAAVDRRIHGEALPSPCAASPAMANLILRACAFSPENRFASATEMKQALIAVGNGSYQAVPIADTDKTVSVRRAPDGGEKKAEAHKGQDARKAVGNFDKAPKKKRKLPAIIALILVLAALAAAGWYFAPKLLDNIGGNQASVVSDADSDYSRQERKKIGDIITAADELASSEAYEDAIDKIQEGMEEYPDSVSLKNKLDEYTENLDTQRINAIIADAESYASKEYYEDAVKKTEEGLKSYPDSKELKNKLDEYNALLAAQLKAETLKDAQALADNGDYKAAMATIEAAQKAYGEDADYKNAYDNYNKKYMSQVKDDALAEAEKLAGGADYIGAYKAIQNALKTVGDDPALSAKAEEYEQKYVSEALAGADGYIAAKNYKEAENVINDALKQFPDNTALKDKLAAIEAGKPVSLSTLTALNSGAEYMNCGKWNTQSPVDPFGNDYSKSSNYRIFEATSYYYEGSAYYEYRLYGKYKSITGNLAPYKSIEEYGKIYMQIFADNKLVYTSPEITRKTDMFGFSVDIGGAEYIKLVVKHDARVDEGALIISDVMLWTE